MEIPKVLPNGLLADEEWGGVGGGGPEFYLSGGEEAAAFGPDQGSDAKQAVLETGVRAHVYITRVGMGGESQGARHVSLPPNLKLRPVREGEDKRGGYFGGEKVLYLGEHGDGDEDAGASRVGTDGVTLPPF